MTEDVAKMLGLLCAGGLLQHSTTLISLYITNRQQWAAERMAADS